MRLFLMFDYQKIRKAILIAPGANLSQRIFLNSTLLIQELHKWFCNSLLKTSQLLWPDSDKMDFEHARWCFWQIPVPRPSDDLPEKISVSGKKGFIKIFFSFFIVASQHRGSRRKAYSLEKVWESIKKVRIHFCKFIYTWLNHTQLGDCRRFVHVKVNPWTPWYCCP